jgi:hypothetical protein
MSKDFYLDPTTSNLIIADTETNELLMIPKVTGIRIWDGKDIATSHKLDGDEIAHKTKVAKKKMALQAAKKLLALIDQEAFYEKIFKTRVD